VSEGAAATKQYTSIRVTREVVELLKSQGKKGETYDDVIKRLLTKRRR